jgi:hypothetical protein
MHGRCKIARIDKLEISALLFGRHQNPECSGNKIDPNARAYLRSLHRFSAGKKFRTTNKVARLLGCSRRQYPASLAIVVSWDDKQVSLSLYRSGRAIGRARSTKGSSRDLRVKKRRREAIAAAFLCAYHCRTLAFSSIAVETTELVRLWSS